MFSVESTVEHVILTIVCSLDEDIRDDMSGYMLRVRFTISNIHFVLALACVYARVFDHAFSRLC